MTHPTQLAYEKAQAAERLAARKRDRVVLEKIAAGMTQRAIAAEMGLTPGRVAQIAQRWADHGAPSE